MQIRLSPLVPCRQDGGDHGHLRRQVRLVLDVPVGVEDGRRPRCPRNLYGVVVYLSSQISIADTVGSSSDCSTIYLYDPSQLHAVSKSDVVVELDRSRLFDTDQSELRADQSELRGKLRVDLIVPNPAAVPPQ